MSMLLLGGFFALVTMAAFLFAQALAPSRVGDRIEHLYTPETVQVKAGGHGFADMGKALNPLLTRFSFTQQLDRKLMQAAMPITAGEFLLTSFLFGAGAVLLGELFLHRFLLAFLLFPLGASLPWFQVEKKRRTFANAINDQLPNALMLIINAVKAGNSFLQALQIVASQMPPPISNQFAHTIQDINWGLTIEAALARLGERVGTVDMDLVITAVLIQRETGGNLSEIFSNIHDTIRERIRMQGEVQALTAQGRLSGWVLSILPTGVGVLFYLFNPSYIMTLFTDPRGQWVAAAALISQVIGVIAIRRIVSIKF